MGPLWFIGRRVCSGWKRFVYFRLLCGASTNTKHLLQPVYIKDWLYLMKKLLKLKGLRVETGKGFKLKKHDPEDKLGFDDLSETKIKLETHKEKIGKLQAKLY